MKNRRAFISGIASTNLKKQEIIFLKKYKPWGVILFARNIQNISQTKKLTKDIRSCFNDLKYPILVDEEGGEISRLKKIINTSIFSSKYFGDLFLLNKKDSLNQYRAYINGVSRILNIIGININTVPVLDVARSKTNKIIKNRSFSRNPKIVSKLGDFCIDIFSKNKIATVIKHIPGHGLARSDSHYQLPIVKKNRNELTKKDFITFKNCKSLFAMTAHVIYSHYDPNYSATHSKIIINDVIRKHIGFKGILMSDDISMKALKYGLIKNAVKALDAGCNLVLHCNGNIKEMVMLSKVIPKIDKFTRKKTSDFSKFLG